MIRGIAKKLGEKFFDAFAFNYSENWNFFFLNVWIACDLGLERSCGVRHQKK
mgnify:CR=1 FL=1